MIVILTESRDASSSKRGEKNAREVSLTHGEDGKDRVTYGARTVRGVKNDDSPQIHLGTIVNCGRCNGLRENLATRRRLDREIAVSYKLSRDRHQCAEIVGQLILSFRAP